MATNVRISTGKSKENRKTAKTRKRKAGTNASGTRKTDVLLGAGIGEIVVAIDVHKKKYHVAVWRNAEIASTWVMPHDDASVVKLMLQAGAGLRKVVYEAGPTGYGLARALQKAAIPVAVIAPGKTPQQPNSENKSDRLDCKRLAKFEAMGLLTYAAIPAAEADAARAVMRRRDGVQRELSRAKTRIKSFLLYHSLAEPVGLQTWSCASVVALRKMRLDEDLRFALDSLLHAMDFAKEERARLDTQLRRIENRQAEASAILRSHPGVGMQTARHVLTELFEPQRFENKRQVVSYVGLAPKVSRSGEGCKTGGRLKAGRKALRDCLIEACWQWIRRDETARAVYNRLVRNTGEVKKAITAMARKMLVNLWTMLCKKEHYRPASIHGATPTSS